MPVNTQPNNSLTLTLGGKVVSCQVIDLQFAQPTTGAPTLVQTACPDGVVSEPGAPEPGTMSGNVYADTLSDGVTYLLLQAQTSGQPLTYELVMWADLGPTKALKFTGSATVRSLALDWAKPGIGKHAFDLAVASATMARPAA